MSCSATCKANFGRTPEESFSYADLISSIHPEDLQSMQAAVRTSIGTAQVYRAETQVWQTEEGASITVADTGSGMSTATLKKIFEPFFSTKGLTGTGLGLWISDEIIRRHRGLLKVRSSQRVGASGTVFTVFLPFNAADRLSEALMEAPQSG